MDETRSQPPAGLNLSDGMDDKSGKATQMDRMRAAAAVAAGRLTGAMVRRLGAGGGTSVPGKAATRVYPDIARYLAAQLRHGTVVITGTNGKTTTSGMTAAALRAGGFRVWRNREGANLLQGVTSALIIRSRFSGHLRWHGDAAAVLEVDEAAFPVIVSAVRPRAIVVTNLFRDQLDRYGEVDTVLRRWTSALAQLSPETRLILNADDPSVASLALAAPHLRTAFFGIDAALPAHDAAALEADIVDTRTCPRCSAPLRFSLRLYSHLGHWACNACGYTRPERAVSAREVSASGMDGSRFTCDVNGEVFPAVVPLPGAYNMYNALAAVTVGQVLGIEPRAALQAIARFEPAFGRGERISVDGREVRLLLAKNPTGLNEVLRALRDEPRPHLLFLLNDQPADGEDVSWIWDAGFESVASLDPAYVATGGLRAYDLALRLKYAGALPASKEPSIERALDHALEATPPGTVLYIVPTYTALLDVRRVLERRGFTAPYWEHSHA